MKLNILLILILLAVLAGIYAFNCLHPPVFEPQNGAFVSVVMGE